MAETLRNKSRIPILALGALAIAAIAVMLALMLASTGPAGAAAEPQFQAGGIPPAQTGDPTDINRTPEPCNFGKLKPETHAGRLIIFDVYFDRATRNVVNNPCPPTFEYETETDRDGFETITGIVRGGVSDTNVDSTVFHVRDTAKRTLKAQEAAKWPFLGNEGDQVWLLPTGDLTDPPNNLDIAFSAELLRPQDWLDLDFEFVSIREPGTTVADRGNLFVFDTEPEEGVTAVRPAWNSLNPDENEIEVQAGSAAGYNWAFTQPGTYVLQVHVKAHPDTEVDLTAKEPSQFAGSRVQTTTSLVREYTFHVGDFIPDPQPMFQVERSVPENSAASTPVGAPLGLVGVGGDALDYTLIGDGSENFAVIAVADVAQLVVAPGADLDFETRPAYDLTLKVRDGKMITGAPDPSFDSAIAVRVALTDDPSDNPAVSLDADSLTPEVGSVATLTATVSNLPAGATDLRYTWAEHDVERTGNWTSTTADRPVWRASHDTPGLRRYRATVIYDDAQGNRAVLHSELLDVTWVSP